ncbi:MAG: GNAT family N-acetyltransferase [Candidatus Omnitrophica bacterium]|nr:GNAT family N-acetyltransferase [Candidatus Omnitrophota bacterium]MBU1997389.1 GNAT family N-acetyltransferase [Candidatus Omnitrophota bacterium]
MKEIIINDKITIGGNNPCFIIAEIGVNHNGDLDTAKRMLKSIKDSGADAAKIQSFFAEDFVVDSELIYEYMSQGKLVKESQFDMFKRLELKPEWHKELFDYAKELDIVLFSTPTSIKFVDLLDDLGVELFKMGSDDLTNLELIKYIASKQKPYLISTGMAKMDDVVTAVKTIEETGNKKYAILHCSSIYPTPLEDVNLNVLKTFDSAFLNSVIGYSDHTVGNSVAMAAVAIGAKIIEKHFTLDKNMPGPDHWMSCDPVELKKLVEDIRNIEKALGSPTKDIAPSEQQNYINCHRSVTAAVDIPINTVLTREMLVLKRPCTGIKPKELGKILGMITTKNISKNESIKWESISFCRDSMNKDLLMESVKIEEATKDDRDIVFKFSNEPTARQLTFSPAPLDYDNHIKWYADYLLNKNLIIYLLKLGNENIGVLKYKIDNNEAVIGIVLKPALRGLGLGNLIIKKSTDNFILEHPNITIVAEIKSSNIASIKSFKKADFIERTADNTKTILIKNAKQTISK